MSISRVFISDSGLSMERGRLARLGRIMLCIFSSGPFPQQVRLQRIHPLTSSSEDGPYRGITKYVC
uniref:Uncharacterized protein n=1 Tax=Utricularia reniformis TaxID=192314 RepID=A0A1Y0AYX0_9LAMI|nr:hypothetical protein AEK19_MT1092 [Utricularia reniformis]ART30347.1 hypothetical protein AEK19_MT1092 [Utricularia reniformis]